MASLISFPSSSSSTSVFNGSRLSTLPNPTPVQSTSPPTFEGKTHHKPLPQAAQTLVTISEITSAILAEQLESVINTLEPDREKLLIKVYQRPSSERVRVIAEAVLGSFVMPSNTKPTWDQSSPPFTLIKRDQECRVYIDTHPRKQVGGFKASFPALFFVINRIDKSYQLSGKWVAKITSLRPNALPQMYWEAIVYNRIKSLEGFPRLLDLLSIRETTNPLGQKVNALFCESLDHLQCFESLDQAIASKSFFDANKINTFIFYMDYLSEDLHDALTQKFSFSSIKKIYQRLAALHEVKLVHMDPKPDNVSIEGSGQDTVFKLFDFNQSAITGTKSSIIRGSPGYKAPEVWPTFVQDRGACYFSELCEPAVDVWGFALILLAMRFKSPVCTPWVKILETLHATHQFQQKMKELEIGEYVLVDGEFEENIAKDFALLKGTANEVAELAKDWKINYIYKPEMGICYTKLRNLQTTFTRCKELPSEKLGYLKMYLPQLRDFQQTLCAALECYKKHLEVCASTTTHTDPFDNLMSKALHPDPSKRITAKGILHLYPQARDAEPL